ncbi:hypothetical protein NX059_011205 [Plenodomus lindquistii]|nr:hypothetical protein NX059_011205 [Plenodomus lindquistii]
MPTTTSHGLMPGSSSRLEGPRKWLQRQLRKTTSRQTMRNFEETAEHDFQLPVKRPSTAPSGQAQTVASAPLPVPAIPISIERTTPCPTAPAPSRQPRPDSDVMRDISAWLEASTITPSPPLMGGLSYWRTAVGPGVKDTSQAQHAIPITQAPERSRPSTAQSLQIRPFRRCARKVQVQMPSILRTRSQKLVERRQKGRSASMPLMTFPYEMMLQGPLPRLLRSPGSAQNLVARPSTSHATPAIYYKTIEYNQPRLGTPASTLGAPEDDVDHRMHIRFPWTSRSADSTRPSTAAADHSREDSTGDLSDAPTYFSGPPPPSYRSRAASVLTTSSFGCIDGMDSAQRQKSQERAALRRGVRGKLKRLAHNFSAQ